MIGALLIAVVTTIAIIAVIIVELAERQYVNYVQRLDVLFRSVDGRAMYVSVMHA